MFCLLQPEAIAQVGDTPQLKMKAWRPAALHSLGLRSRCNWWGNGSQRFFSMPSRSQTWPFVLKPLEADGSVEKIPCHLLPPLTKSGSFEWGRCRRCRCETPPFFCTLQCVILMQCRDQNYSGSGNYFQELISEKLLIALLGRCNSRFPQFSGVVLLAGSKILNQSESHH